LDGPLKSLHLPILIRRKFEPARLHLKIGKGLLDLQQCHTLETLEHGLNGAVLRTANLLDDGFCPDRIEIIEARILFSWIALCNDQDSFLFRLQGGVDGGDGSIATDRDWHEDAGEQDCSFDGEDR
jgi:hypothetical protein